MAQGLSARAAPQGNTQMLVDQCDAPCVLLESTTRRMLRQRAQHARLDRSVQAQVPHYAHCVPEVDFVVSKVQQVKA